MTNDRTAPPPLRPAGRVPPERFQLPIERLRQGYYSDKYFVRTREVLLHSGHNPRVTMQIFQKQSACLGGVDEAIAVLKLCLTDGYAWRDLDVLALRDGDFVEPLETVMLVTGPFAAFAHLETVYLGVLGRRTRVATNTRRVVEAAWPKPVLFFPARFDHWLVQTGDGYAAHIAGAIGVSTDAQASWWGAEGLGTVPHALIAAFGGDTVAATRAFADAMPADVKVISLVDFDNDCVGTSLAVARALGSRLHGVRLDTSEWMVDRSLLPYMGERDPRGVNPQLVRLVRAALDAAQFRDVRITVSGGFAADKISQFEREQVPVDSYGVGSSLFAGRFDFTGDVVMVEGQRVAKQGRRYRPNPRLERVE
jgi:nicotinate phosphoribosyltransferase